MVRFRIDIGSSKTKVICLHEKTISLLKPSSLENPTGGNFDPLLSYFWGFHTPGQTRYIGSCRILSESLLPKSDQFRSKDRSS
jgi:hypothetical protein